MPAAATARATRRAGHANQPSVSAAAAAAPYEPPNEAAGYWATMAAPWPGKRKSASAWKVVVSVGGVPNGGVTNKVPSSLLVPRRVGTLLKLPDANSFIGSSGTTKLSMTGNAATAWVAG